MIRKVARHTWLGLVVFGAVFWTMPPEDVVRTIIWGQRRERPPVGHPERLVPDVPPTPEEAALWRQLEFLQRVV
jgi:hypothetical protein